MSGQPMALSSCRDLKDPPRVSGSAGIFAGGFRCRARRLGRHLSSVGFRTPAPSGANPRPSTRARCASERPRSPPAWRSRYVDRCACPDVPKRGSRWTTLRHVRHADDVPLPASARDSCRRPNISAVLLRTQGTSRRPAGPPHMVDGSARLRRQDSCPASATRHESGAVR